MKSWWYGWVLICLIQCTGCRPLEVEISTLDLSSWRWEGVEEVRMEWTGNQAKVVVPWGTDRTQLTPVFRQIGPGTVVPKSGQTQDFSKPRIYTVHHPSGGKQVYQISVQEADPPTLRLGGYSPRSLAIGDTLRFWGKAFRGGLPTVGWQAASGNRVYADVRRIQDTLFQVIVPTQLYPGTYRLHIECFGHEVVGSPHVSIHYPAPQIHNWRGHTYWGGDTLVFQGQYFSGGGYTYTGFLRQGDRTWQWEWQHAPVILPVGVNPGTYDFQIKNKTLGKSTPWQSVPWKVGDPSSPHVFPDLVGRQKSVWGDTLQWEVRGWPGHRTQLQLEHARGMVVVMGYRDGSHRVVYPLPRSGPAGEMTLRFLFFTGQGQEEYVANTTIQF